MKGIVTLYTILLLSIQNYLVLSDQVADGIDVILNTHGLRPTNFLTIPAPLTLTQPKKTTLLDPRLLSISVEFCYFVDFAGLPGNPNPFTKTLINYLAGINGYAPAFRVGGNSQDRARYVSNISVIINDPKTKKVYVGSGFYAAFANLNTKYTFGINFAYGDYNDSLRQLQTGYSAIKDHGLEHIELGNEVDLYKNITRSPWNANLYTKQFNNFTQNFVKVIPFGKLFQLGVIGRSPRIANKHKADPWTATQILNKDLIDTTHANSWSNHFYAQSACSPSDIIKLSYTKLVSHTVIKANLDQYKTDISSVRSKGLDFVFGEGNSVVCHGYDGMSNTMISTIWAIDHALYGGYIGIKRFYMHSGRNFLYNVFQPNGTHQGIRPLFYAYVLMANAIKSTTRIAPIITSPLSDNLVVYGLYENSKLKKMIVINSKVFNSTTPGPRPFMVVQYSGHKGTLHRLTGPGADVKMGLMYAGQSFSDSTGKPIGTQMVENWSNSFILKATEAALVFISN